LFSLLHCADINAEKMKAELDSKYGSMSLLNFKSKKNFEDDLLRFEIPSPVTVGIK
jgi:hypothetical protein